jgi:hypothetical protein
VLTVGAVLITAVQIPRLNYVALGDSYSSGEGNPPYSADSGSKGDYCHRSAQAYPEVLSSQLPNSQLRFYACSGATTSHILTDRRYTENAQIGRSGVDRSANLVTITLGGNDAGFSDVLSACILQSVNATLGGILPGRLGSWLGLSSDPSCSSSASFSSSVSQGIDDVRPLVQDTYKELRQQTDPVNTSIIGVGYPRLFPSSVIGHELRRAQLVPDA